MGRIRRIMLFIILLCIAVVAESLSAERTVVLLYNKPEGVVVTHAPNDVLGRPNVYQEIESMKGYTGSRRGSSFEEVTRIRSKLHAIGRLDADTSGLLLLTNDGGLLHHVTNKEASTNDHAPISKTYKALIMGCHPQNSPLVAQLKQGVDIGDKYGGQTLPVEHIDIIETHKTTTEVELSICEGKNRQVRRMFHALKSGVMRLERTHVGNLDLTGLERGQWRLLDTDEVSVGLKWKEREILPDVNRDNKHKTRKRRRGSKRR